MASCSTWKGNYSTALVGAGRWVADGVDEDGFAKFKVVADDTPVTEEIWKAANNYDTSGCPEVEAAAKAAEAEAAEAFAA